MPKVMKSMFNNLCRKPSIVNTISIPTFLVMGKYIICSCLLNSVSHLIFFLLGHDLTYKIMDCPVGYVCRINSLLPHSFPTKESNAVNLIPVLELILRAKSLMENNLDMYDKANSLRLKVSFTVMGQSSIITPCFHVNKKLKRSTYISFFFLFF